mmetsp:Transcript_7636/g.15326  ORF Transcript_7636/g.15326 Transcript_7636/m.15326 type:complete len:142 (-) Transcript_7636:716-1141(-)
MIHQVTSSDASDGEAFLGEMLCFEPDGTLSTASSELEQVWWLRGGWRDIQQSGEPTPPFNVWRLGMTRQSPSAPACLDHWFIHLVLPCSPARSAKLPGKPPPTRARSSRRKLLVLMTVNTTRTENTALPPRAKPAAEPSLV